MKNNTIIEEEINIIKIAVNEYYDLKEEEVLSKDRHRNVMEGRRLICYILRHDLGMKFQNIAKCLNLNHSSVIYHCKTLQGYLDNKDSKAIKDYNFVISSLNADNTTIDLVKNIKDIDKDLKRLTQKKDRLIMLLNKKQNI